MDEEDDSGTVEDLDEGKLEKPFSRLNSGKKIQTKSFILS